MWTNTEGFLALAAIFLIVFQVYNKRRKYVFKNNCVGLEALPKVKNLLPFDPFKLIGSIHNAWPINRALTNTLARCEEMGEFFRIEILGEDLVMFNSGPTLQVLLKSGDFGHLHKAPKAYGPMKPFISNGLLVSDGAFWQKQRKILMKSQSYQNLRGYMEMLNRHSKRLVQNLETKFQDGKSHTINEILNVTFLEVISEMITGEKLDRSDELLQYHKNFSFWKDTLPVRILNPLLLIGLLWRLHPRCKKHERACKELCEFALRRINEAKRKRETAKETPIEDKPAFRSVIDDLLDAGIDDNQIVDEVNVMMFGGHETGTSTIHCLLFALALNPEVQQKARQEVDELFTDSDKLENERIPFEATQGGLKYVERCILETLRLFPPVFASFRQLLSPLKVEYDGKSVIIPPGTNCAIAPFHVHRQERHYPNPLKFDPDRFLPEEVEKRHPYIYIPFSAGPRNCLGQKFAMIEMKIITSYILRNFEMTTTDKIQDVTWLPYTTTTPEKDFVFQIKKRNIP